jgi:hypothetical protein
MSTNRFSATLETIFKYQAIWSEVANQLKSHITFARATALSLGILGAFTATLAAQLAPNLSLAARILSIVSAAALATATVVARGFGQKQLQNWIRARSVSEALKQEMFLYLTGTPPYAANDRDAVLHTRTNEVLNKVSDLTVLAVTVPPPTTDIPKIDGPDDYIRLRVSQQTQDYYFPKASLMAKRLMICQSLATGLTALAAVVSGIAGFFHTESIGAWVAVATTIAGAIVAHAGAARYEHNVLSYYSTARQLESLRDQYLDSKNDPGAPARFHEFVRRCEEVISIENQAWMADWQKMGNSAPPVTTRPP